MGTILILEQGHEKLAFLGSELYKLFLAKGARVFDLVKTHSGHVALKVDECGAAAEDKVRPASGTAGTPATSDAHAYMMSQDTKGICFSIDEKTHAFAIQSWVNSTLKTWRHRNTSFGNAPTPADQDFALRNLQAKVHQAISGEDSKWTPPD
eukprot:3359728-Pyramimonas_sp.AAC.1